MTQGDHFERELLIVKIKINSESQQEINHLISEFNAVILDDSIESYTIQLTGKIEEIDKFVSKISTLGTFQAVARSGSVSVSKGKIILSSYANKNLSN